jgi:iron complex transport system substrate-binding protein
VKRHAFLVACAAFAFAAKATTLRDDRGVELVYAAPPQRIVSLLPSLTESVCALGACARLVGVDRYSNHPASVRVLPNVGGLDDSNVEAIVALKPDLVLAGTSARVIARLETLGLKVAAIEPRDIGAAQRTLLQLDTLLATGTATTLWRRIDADVSAAARSIPAGARGARVYIEVATGPYAASEAAFSGELLKRLGLVNIVPASLGLYPLLNPEFVVRADPDLILIADRHAGELPARPGWKGLRAKVCAFTAWEGDLLARAGPRLGEAAALIARCAAHLGSRR